MAPARKRTANLARPRRLDDEDESRSIVTDLDLAEDSQSDASVPSDVDEDADADADNSDLSDADSGIAPSAKKSKRRANGARNVNAKAAPAVNNRQPSPPIARSDVTFTASKDTAAADTVFLMQKRLSAPQL